MQMLAVATSTRFHLNLNGRFLKKSPCSDFSFIFLVMSLKHEKDTVGLGSLRAPEAAVIITTPTGRLLGSGLYILNSRETLAICQRAFKMP